MTLMLMKRRWQVAIYCTVCALIWTAWVFLYGLPRLGQIRQAKMQLTDVNTGFAQLSGTVQNIPAQLESLKETEEEIERSLAALPSEEGIPELSRRLAKQATSCGLEVISTELGLETIFGTAEEGVSLGLSKLSFTLTVRGSYGQVGESIERICATGPYIECASVTYDRLAGFGRGIEATIVMNLYTLARRSGGFVHRSQVAMADGVTGRETQ